MADKVRAKAAETAALLDEMNAVTMRDPAPDPAPYDAADEITKEMERRRTDPVLRFTDA